MIIIVTRSGHNKRTRSGMRTRSGALPGLIKVAGLCTSKAYPIQCAGTVNPPNVRKCYVAIGTGFTQTWHTNWLYHFSPWCFNVQWDENFICFQVYFERLNNAKLVSKILNHFSKELTRIWLSQSLLQFGFYWTTMQWQMMLNFAAEMQYLSHR